MILDTVVIIGDVERVSRDVIGIGGIGDVRLIPLKRYTLDDYTVIIQTTKNLETTKSRIF